MQEEASNRAIAICIKGGKISEEILEKTLADFVKELKLYTAGGIRPQSSKGKQSLKSLAGQNCELRSVKIDDSNIKSFDRVANKYSIDYALKKDIGSKEPSYYVFFKARDHELIKRAFEEYSSASKSHSSKQSIEKKLSGHIEEKTVLHELSSRTRSAGEDTR